MPGEEPAMVRATSRLTSFFSEMEPLTAGCFEVKHGCCVKELVGDWIFIVRDNYANAVLAGAGRLRRSVMLCV